MVTTTEANLERHIRLLIDAWFKLDHVRPLADDAEDGEINVLLNSLGLANAAAECTLAFLDADRDNRLPRGILARSIYEFGVTCVWLSLRSEEGLIALEYEKKRQQRAMAASLLRGPLKERIRPAAESRLDQQLGSAPALAAEARNLEARVKSLDAGDTDLYALYRLYSDFAHASLTVANSYVVDEGDGNLAIQVPSPHQAINDDLGTAVAPLVWAINATDKLRHGHPMLAKLKTIEVLLETGVDFTLKDPMQV